MKTICQFSIITAVILVLTTFAQPASAEISTTGDVDPANPATWTSNTPVYIGKTSNGTMNITGSSTVSSGGGYIGYSSSSTGAVTVDGAGSTWTSGSITIGNFGNGTLNITDGGTVSNKDCHIGYYDSMGGEVTVDGADSTWTNNGPLYIGGTDGGFYYGGNGTLNITNGGAVSSGGIYLYNHVYYYFSSYIGYSDGSTGEVTVDGAGSTWTNNLNLYVSDYYFGSGTLEITNGGLVSVAGTLGIGSNDYINMATGGMLALHGQADESLGDFMNLISGADAIRYWDDSTSDWADITGATYGMNYTLSYLTEGDLDGYTMLTVTTIPEPTTILLLGLGGLMLRRKNR